MVDFEEFLLDSVVQGHHVYKSTWTPYLGEVLPAEVEEGNHEDQYNVVTVYKSSVAVGHVPHHNVKDILPFEAWWLH